MHGARAGSETEPQVTHPGVGGGRHMSPQICEWGGGGYRLPTTASGLPALPPGTLRCLRCHAKVPHSTQSCGNAKLCLLLLPGGQGAHDQCGAPEGTAAGWEALSLQLTG